MVLFVQLVLVSVPVLHSAAVASWSYSLKPSMPAFIHQSQIFRATADEWHADTAQTLTLNSGV
jgi:hypothetical protein